ncbi:MAG: hypothetical protein V8S98_05225 [Lachnospiraceae bacterium]
MLTIAAMLFENVIGIKMYLVASVGAVLLLSCGVLSEQEALASIHQPTVFYLPEFRLYPMRSV